jgi:hypothetical protein
MSIKKFKLAPLLTLLIVIVSRASCKTPLCELIFTIERR